MFKASSLLVLTLLVFNLKAQDILRGLVKDQQNQPIFAANVYLKNSQKGTFTDLEGRFELPLEHTDTLIISFIGYEKQAFACAELKTDQVLEVTLTNDKARLLEITVEANKIIAEEFSAIKMTKFDIYANPVANADPLRAIVLLPSSTNPNETANPELRGSAAGRSRVFFNSVPIYNPVRSSQINGLGFFSLFNPELIKRQVVYASNPPLIYGKASGGLVELETVDELKANNFQVALSLASLSFLTELKLSAKQTDFIQVYGNYQFSKPYTALNRPNLDFLNQFKTQDLGLNFRKSFTDYAYLNLYSYVIAENAGIESQSLNYKTLQRTANLRNFTILNYRYQKQKHVVTFNAATDWRKSDYEFGNADYRNRQLQLFQALNYKYIFKSKLSLQTGLHYHFTQVKVADTVPVFFFAQNPEAPTQFRDTLPRLSNLESYLYLKTNFKKFILGLGFRNNVPLDHDSFYTNYQFNLKYTPNKRHNFLLAGGRYQHYSVFNPFGQEFRLLSSWQLALDYTLAYPRSHFNLAAYYKRDESDLERQIQGIEVYYEQNLGKYFKITFSNTFLDVQRTEGRDFNDLDYFIKTSLAYNNLRLFMLSLLYIHRPGLYYQPVRSTVFYSQLNSHEPIFDPRFSNQYGAYQALSLSLNKVLALKSGFIIVFLNLNNVFNTDNPQQAIYNFDYTQGNYTFYQKRSLYFGVVVKK